MTLLEKYIATMEHLNCIFVGYDDKEIIFQIPDSCFWTKSRIKEMRDTFEDKFNLKLKVRRLF